MRGGSFHKLFQAWLVALLWWSLAAGVTYLIFRFTLTPDTVADPNRQLPHYSANWVNELLQKGGHFAAFALLAGSLYMAISTTPHPKVNPWVITPLIASVIAAGTEIGQSWVPGRYSNPLDILIDLGGIVTGLLGMLTLRAVWRRFNQKPNLNLKGGLHKALSD
jgi:VanZ family protein